MRKLKRILTFCLVVAILASFLGFFISTAYYVNPNNILPLYRVNDIQVDSGGNIYIGIEHFRIQVFDKEGNYLYPICFDNLGGAFLFYVNSENRVDIYSPSIYTQYSFYKDEMLTKIKVDSNLGPQTRSLFLSVRNQVNTYFDNEGNKFCVIDDEVFIQRNAGDSLEKIKFITPLIPFRPFTHIVIIGINLFLVFLLNCKALYGLLSSMKGAS